MTQDRLVTLVKGTLLLLVGAVGLAACNSEDVGTAEDALTIVQGSQQTCEALGAGVHQCLGALHTCVQGAGDAAAIDACKTTFAGCLPVDPPAHEGRGGPHHGGHHGPPPGDHMGPPPDGDHHGGGDMAGGCPGMGGADDACNPSAPIVDACKANLDACLASGAAPAGCIATADDCVSSAIQGRFKAICAQHASAVCDGGDADAVACDQLDRACNDGVTLPDTSVARPNIPIQMN